MSTLRGKPFYAVLKVIIPVLFIACGLGVFLTVKKPPAPAKTQTEPHAVPIMTDVVRTMDVAEEVNARGTLESREMSDVGFRLPGRIETLHVDEGAHVKAGEPLARLESSQYVLNRRDADKAFLQATGQVIQANAHLRKAEATHADAAKDEAIARRLYESKTIAKEELDKAVLALDVAHADLIHAREQLHLAELQAKRAAIGVETAEIQLNDTVITAPMDGVVTSRSKYLGEVVAAGTPVFRIEDLSVLKLKADISSSYSERLKTGLKVMLEIEGLTNPVEGRIDEISDTVHPVARTLEITVRIRNPDKKYKPGMFARATIALEVHPGAVVVPRESLVEEESGTSVFLIEDGIANKIAVETGFESRGMVEIAGDVPPGAVVAVIGQANLRDGVKVLVR